MGVHTANFLLSDKNVIVLAKKKKKKTIGSCENLEESKVRLLHVVRVPCISENNFKHFSSFRGVIWLKAC